MKFSRTVLAYTMLGAFILANIFLLTTIETPNNTPTGYSVLGYITELFASSDDTKEKVLEVEEKNNFDSLSDTETDTGSLGIETETNIFAGIPDYEINDAQQVERDSFSSGLGENSGGERGSPEGACGHSITRFAITWHFDPNLPAPDCGFYADGSPWVVGPVTITRINPSSTSGINVEHGSMLNPKGGSFKQHGFDSRLSDLIYNDTLNVGLDLSATNPLIIQTGSLLSTGSKNRQDQYNVFDASVLTVVNANEKPNIGDFRPSYSGTNKKSIYNVNQIDMNKLSNLPKSRLANQSNAPSLAKVKRSVERIHVDFLEQWTGKYTAAKNNHHQYGREISTKFGEAHLSMNLNYTNAEKLPIVIDLIQRGIDFAGVIFDGGEIVWHGNGGHTGGREFAVIFAGVMLDAPELYNIVNDTGAYFAEDDQTFYVSSLEVGKSTRGSRYTNSDIGLPEWSPGYRWDPNDLYGHFWDSYRVCCTATGWQGDVLAAQIMGLREVWNHDALFDYTDRYMQVQGGSFRSWSRFMEDAWDTFRDDYACVWRPATISKTSHGSHDCSQGGSPDNVLCLNRGGGTCLPGTSCVQVSSHCSQYKTKNSCEYDPCGVRGSGSCRWNGQTCVLGARGQNCDPNDPPRACGTSTGTCTTGTQVCDPNTKQWGLCSGQGPVPEICDGLDNDCDGTPDNNLKLNACTKQLGVCAGSKEECKETSPGNYQQVCDDVVYSKHNAAYENPEASCDLLDNNCDGAVDKNGVATVCTQNCTQIGGTICKANEICTGTLQGSSSGACCVGGQGCQTFSATQIGGWNFEDNLKDTIGTNDAQCATGECPTYITGINGKAAKFDGINDIARIPRTTTLENFDEITITAWVWLDAPAHSGGSTPFAKTNGQTGRDAGFNIRQNEGWSAVFNNNEVPAPNIPQTKKWHFLTGTYDGTTIRTYIDGKLAASKALTGKAATTTGVWAFGAHADAPDTRRLNGAVDDARIYNKALTAAEIDLVMKDIGGGPGGNTRPNTPSNLAAQENGTTNILLQWNDNANNEDGFYIERDTDPTFPNPVSASVGPDTTTFSDTFGLTASTTYYYRVLAYNAAGNSGWSNVANGTTSSGGPAGNCQQITRHAITWTFSNTHECGTFANGDPWVIGPITVTSITRPNNKAGRDGTQLNPMTAKKFGLDSRMDYDSNLNVANNLPLTVPSGSSLLSSISTPLECTQTLAFCQQKGNKGNSAIGCHHGCAKTLHIPIPIITDASVLTILASKPADNSFRPPYTGTDKTIRHNEADLDYTLLQRLAPTPAAPTPASVAPTFERVWLDHLDNNAFGGHIHPNNNKQIAYGGDMQADVSKAALTLHLDYTPQQKRDLMVYFVQHGIDLCGIIRNGGANRYLHNGGINVGRMWPIAFASMVLNDTSIGTDCLNDNVRLQEKDQTLYVTQEMIDISNKPLCTQYGQKNCWAPDGRSGGTKPYDQNMLGIPGWTTRPLTFIQGANAAWGATYRQCCTARGWQGNILAAIFMNAGTTIGDQDLLDYTDRYLQVETSTSYRSYNAFLKEMWDTYRNKFYCEWRRDNPNNQHSQGYYRCPNTNDAGEQNIICSTKTGGSCASQNSCTTIGTDCEDYKNKNACEYNPCELDACRWNGQTCVTGGWCKNGTQRACGVNKGECTQGIQTCTNNAWGTCSGKGPSKEICDGKDNDCNGQTDDNLNLQPCRKQQGVCAGSQEECKQTNGTWKQTCDYQTYTQHDPRYENPEASCDLLDNNCDGGVDKNGATTVCSQTCSQLGGAVCNATQTCSGTLQGSSNGACCVNGRCETFTARLISQWNFEGDLTDTKGTNNGQCSGTSCPTYTQGKNGKAAKFDGINDKVTIPRLLGTQKEITITAWANLEGADTNGAEIINIGDYVILRLDQLNGAGLTGWYKDAAGWESTTTNTFYEGKGWHHYAWVVDPTNNRQELYVNAISKKKQTKNAPISYTGAGTDTLIGTHATGKTGFDFRGIIDDVRVYNKALTTKEIDTVMKDTGGGGTGGGAVCGNGKIEAPETCDDANTNNGDGCSSACTIENGWSCNGEPSNCTRNNRPPTLFPIGDKTVVENEQLTFIVRADDLDNDTLTFTATNLPTGATFDTQTQRFNWKPTTTQKGIHTDIEFNVSDGKGGSDNEQIDIEVLDDQDDDGDGVVNGLDRCKGTPVWLHAVVNQWGCPKANINRGKYNDRRTTNISALNNLSAATNFAIGTSGAGIIDFGTNKINLLRYNDTGKYHYPIPINKNVHLQRNEISIDGDNLPEFNRKAQLTFINTTITNPIIKRDGKIEKEIVYISYNVTSTNLVADVPGFSNYTVEEGSCGDTICSITETKTNCPQDCGGTGGNNNPGGGGGPNNKKTIKTITINLDDNKKHHASITEKNVIEITVDKSVYKIRIETIKNDVITLNFTNITQTLQTKAFTLYTIDLDRDKEEDIELYTIPKGTQHEITLKKIQQTDKDEGNIKPNTNDGTDKDSTQDKLPPITGTRSVDLFIWVLIGAIILGIILYFLVRKVVRKKSFK